MIFQMVLIQPERSSRPKLSTQNVASNLCAAIRAEFSSQLTVFGGDGSEHIGSNFSSAALAAATAAVTTPIIHIENIFTKFCNKKRNCQTQEPDFADDSIAFAMALVQMIMSIRVHEVFIYKRTSHQWSISNRHQRASDGRTHRHIRDD